MRWFSHFAILDFQTDTTYSKEDISQIHTTENSVTDTSEVGVVTRDNQENGDDVMSHHGKVILSSLFNVDSVYLLDPKRKLHQIIALHVLGNENMGIVNPVL